MWCIAGQAFPTQSKMKGNWFLWLKIGMHSRFLISEANSNRYSRNVVENIVHQWYRRASQPSSLWEIIPRIRNPAIYSCADSSMHVFTHLCMQPFIYPWISLHSSIPRYIWMHKYRNSFIQPCTKSSIHTAMKLWFTPTVMDS